MKRKPSATAQRPPEAARGLSAPPSAVIPIAGPANWYDATRDTKRRRRPTTLLSSEDRVLLASGRTRMLGTARDLRRNFSDAAWAIRKHLDFVSNFSFHARTGDAAFDRELEARVEWWSQPSNFDLSGRHGRRRYTRLLEACAVVDGDCGSAMISDGTLQAVEGDRIRSAGIAELDAPDVVHGVRLHPVSGRPLRYIVCKRTPLGATYELDREVPARFFLLHGYVERFDQVRGITPLSTALNDFQDLREGRTYALARAKIAQLFGIVIKRAESDDMASQLTKGVADTGSNPYLDTWQTALADGGVPVLDMDAGDDTAFMENKTPSSEFQAFDAKILASALKSLDLPFSFWDEAHTNFFGSKSAQQLYLFACETKRENLVNNFLNRWLRWRLFMAIAAGELPLPGAMQPADIEWEWVPAGLPWWRPLEEVRADSESVRNGFSSVPRACKEDGADAYAILEETKKYAIAVAAAKAEVHAAGGVWPDEIPTSVTAAGTEATLLQAELAGKDARP